MADIPGDISLKKRVGIIGGSSPSPQAEKKAEMMGELIADAGMILVNGGMGGIMKASARGAKKKGGFVLSILPGQSSDEGNSFTDIAMVTGMGHLRNPLVALNSDILVAVEGSYGTLSEIAFGKLYGKKILGLDTWDIEGVESFSDPRKVMEKIRLTFELSGEEPDLEK